MSDSEDDQPVYRSIAAPDLFPPPPTRQPSGGSSSFASGEVAPGFPGVGMWLWEGDGFPGKGAACAPPLPSPDDIPARLSRQRTREEQAILSSPLKRSPPPPLFHVGSAPSAPSAQCSRHTSPSEADVVDVPPPKESLRRSAPGQPPPDLPPPGLTDCSGRTDTSGCTDGADEAALEMGAAASNRAAIAPARTASARLHRRSASEGDVDDLVEDLAHEWARLKLETTSLRSRCSYAAETVERISATNATILAELRAGTQPVPVAAEAATASSSSACTVSPAAATTADPDPNAGVASRRPRMATNIVVVEHVDDDDDEVDGGESDGDGDGDADGGDSGGTMRAATDEAHSRALSYDDDSPVESPPPLLPFKQASLGKRARSYTSELLAEPLHPSKVPSETSRPSRTSPSAEQMRIGQLRELIAREKAEREALLAAFLENERTLQRLQQINAELRAEVARLRGRCHAAVRTTTPAGAVPC